VDGGGIVNRHGAKRKLSRPLRDALLGIRLVRYHSEVQFLGRCPCGDCDYWLIGLHGKTHPATKERYDELRRHLAKL
jgi:hypothetical protein